MVRDVVDAFPGAPGYWAGTFIALGWTAHETRLYLQTSAADADSPLRQETDSLLAAELRAYATARNMSVGGVPSEEKHSDGRCTYRLRQILTLEEQDAVLREVSGYARVLFIPTSREAYVDHSVAKAVRQVGHTWLRSMVPRGATCLEVGANLVTVVLTGLDPAVYHGYVPVLGPRDSARQSVPVFLQNIAKGEKRGFSASQKEMAELMVNDMSKICTRGRIEDDTRRGEYIISNHSDYDIDLDDVPAIMAKHNTRAWYGVITRVKGLNSVETSARGEIPILGVRYVIDRTKDLIEFHFKGRATFTYRHRFSSYVKREERNEFRWRGLYHDYVYTKLPTSTASTLMYAIYRVARDSGVFKESRFLSTGLADMARIKSVRVFRRGGRWLIAPHEFVMERLAIDKVMEYRRSQGVRGNVVTTLAYMRSVRVRFYLNGVAVGVEHSVSSETFESAAVFVELMMTMYRAGGDRDVDGIMDVYRRVKADSTFVDNVAFWLRGLVVDRFSGVMNSLKSWREALEKSVLSWVDFAVGLEPCDEFVKVDEPCDANLVENELRGTGCACRELREVNAALATESLYTADERMALGVYQRELLVALRDCHCGEEKLPPVAAERQGFGSDASSTTVVGEDEEVEQYFDCEDEVGVTLSTGDLRAQSVREYAGLMLFQEEATNTESLRLAMMVFKNGKPTSIELHRFATPRCTPFVVKVEQGRLVQAEGEGATVDVSAIVDVVGMKVVRVKTKGAGKRKDVVGVPDGWHYTSSALKVYNGRDLADAALELLGGRYSASGVASLPLSFVRGAFGCGKTRRIVKEMAQRISAGENVGYLSQTVASVTRVVRDLERLGLEASKRCHTLDSYLLHKDVRYDCLYLDEAPMAHSGQLIACLAKAAAKWVLMFGDFKQIPFCSFTKEYKTPLASLDGFVEDAGKMVELHRTPYDVLAAWNDEYDGELRACACCEHVRAIDTSLEMHRITDISKVPVMTGARYMTFTHVDKEKLHKALGFDLPVEVLKVKDKDGLSTVHEDQGGTHDRVVLVRATPKYDPKENPDAPSIFNRKPYALVAMTRHKEKFSYYTVSQEDDVVCKRVRIAKDPEQRKVVLGEN